MTDPMEKVPNPPVVSLAADHKEDPLPDNDVIQPDVDPAILAEDAAQAERRKHRRRMSREHIKKLKRRHRIRRIAIAFLIFFAVLVALGAWFAVSAWKAKDEVEAAVKSASNIQSQVMGGDTAAAKRSIETFERHLDAAYKQTNSLPWHVASLAPYYGSDIRTVREAMLIFEDISNNVLPKLADSVDALNFNGIGIKDGTIQLGGLADVAGKLSAANTVLADKTGQFKQLEPTHIDQLNTALDSAKGKLGQLSDLVDLGSRVANALPPMMNLDPNAADASPRTYLVLVQNNAEIRTTGGIAGAWGLMHVDQGKLSIDEFQTDYHTWDEPVLALTAEERTLFSDNLGRYRQDVNFTPEFPRSAQLAAEMWRQMYGQQDIDGVLSIDPVVLQNLLKVTGGVTLDNGMTLDGNNAAQMLLNQAYFDIPTQQEQNVFFSMAAGAAFQHVMGNAGGKSSGLVNAVKQSVIDGHLYLWSAHDDEQKQLSGTTIAGELSTDQTKPITGVYLNDSTMGKMDWYLEHKVTSEAGKTYADGSKQYTIHITLKNTLDAQTAASLPAVIRGFDGLGSTTSNERQGQIISMLYVYAPAGGRLVDWSITGPDGQQADFDGITVHDSLTVGVKSVTLQPGEELSATIHVTTSPLGGDTGMVVRQTPLT
ncbi:DUF4012 domain-containing protein [Bifidobacterium simiiventris]|uniref:DUF4012 domain-containing protein n=1 Tax=Bifidobacterium simiiventris TaxID=2834434 RepID=UPI001C55FAF8|nr:DUF4012 domain-containing protein [Bifidobacterium simiiventris]MBW3078669.1 DUF4012 domain-containing protein [Bifidobacterium simiiventris]